MTRRINVQSKLLNTTTGDFLCSIFTLKDPIISSPGGKIGLDYLYILALHILYHYRIRQFIYTYSYLYNIGIDATMGELSKKSHQDCIEQSVQYKFYG